MAGANSVRAQFLGGDGTLSDVPLSAGVFRLSLCFARLVARCLSARGAPVTSAVVADSRRRGGGSFARGGDGVPSGDVSRETLQTPAEPGLTVPELLGELDRLQGEVRTLVDILNYEVGQKWMSLELRLQIEKLEELLRLQFTPEA